MDTKSKRLVTLGLLLAFTVALPLFVWGIVSQKFELREKASVAPTCQPRPDCLNATPHPCEITEPDEGWCPTTTTSPTSSPQNTSTSAPIGGLQQGEPNSCGGTCGSKYNCGTNLFCYQGFCRNPICPTDTDCACSTPSPTPKPTATPKKTVKPTPTVEIVYVSPNPSVSPSPSPTSSPTAASSGSPEVADTSPNLNFLLYIAGGAFTLAVLLLLASRKKW